jgi:hypothetical protein
MTRILLSVFSLALLFSPTVVSACSCAQPPSPKKALQASRAVFSGKVIKIRREGDQNKVTFEVANVWKGVKTKKVTITTHSSGSLCGYSFQKDQSYIVYCHSPQDKKQGTLRVSLCSRTKSIKNAKEDLQDVGAGIKIE